MIPETYLNLRIANLEAAKNQALMSLLEHLINSVSQWHQIEVTQQLQRELISLLKNLAQNPSAQDRYKNFITAKSESATIVFLSYLSECFAKIPELKQVPPELLSIAEHNFNERIHLLTTQFNEAQLDASQLQSLQIKRKTNQDTQELFKVDEQTQLQAIQAFLNGNNDFDKSLASIKKGILFDESLILNLCFQRTKPALAALQQILRQNRRTQFLETLQDKDTGAAALHAAVSDNHPLSTKPITVNEQRVQLQWLGYLLQQGANPQQGDNQGNTPLHILLAAGVQPHRRCSLEAISLLITPHPSLVHALNHFQEYPLHMAVQAGWAEAVQCLLQYPYEHWPVCPETGDTLLHILVRKLSEKKDAASYRTIMSLLLEHPTLAKSCINLPNKAGETLLCLAVQAQDCSTVTQLLQHPEWEEVRDENNGIPVLVAQAREMKNKELATLLEACRCTQRTPSTSWHRTLDTFRQIRVTYHALEKLTQANATFTLLEKHSLYAIAAQVYNLDDSSYFDACYQHFSQFRLNTPPADAFIEAKFAEVKTFLLIARDQTNQQISSMGSMAEMLKMQAQELLLCNELMGQELEEVIIGVQTVLLSWLNLDKTQLAREMTQATPRTKSALIQNFIMNSFVTTDGSLLPENTRIDLSGFDLTRVDLRGMDLHRVNFDRCCVEEMNITQTVASPEQFSQASGITTLITTCPQFIADIQALQFAALCTPIVAMVNALETVEDEIAIHELLHRLEQQKVECNSLTDVELAQLTLYSLNSSRLNLLDEKERCCYTRIAPQLAANGTEAFLSQSREVHQALLVSVLDKLNLPLAAQTIAVEKLNKLIALENRLIANGFLQRHRVKEKMHDLTSEQRSQLTGLLEHWKKQEHLAAEKIRAVRIQYEAHYFATLYRPIVENQKITQVEFDTLVDLLQNNPDLKVVLDFTAIDLSAVNLSLCPNLHKMYLKLSPSQIETHLTPLQKAQREEAFRAAVEAENRQEMERWLNCGVDVNAAHPETGRTALMSACYKSCRLELVEYLLEQGANPNLRSARGWCIIRSVIQDIQHDAAYRDIAKCLLQHGAILEPASAMILAIAEQNEAIFEQAIAACSPEALHAIEPATNQTLLHTAVGLKSLLFIDKLVTTYQFDPFEMNDKEQNAFYFAVKAVSYECLSQLFEGLGEGEQRDNSAPFALAVRSYFDSLQSKTPDIYARHAIYFHMLQLFEQKGCQPNLEAAIALKQEAVVIQHWRGNLTDAQRSQVLQKIVLTNQLELLNALLGQRIQPNLNVREPVTGTLLHVACRQGNLAMMKFLHDEGAELKPSQQAAQKALAEPLLITAIRCQRHHIVRWLLQKKMDVEQMHNGRTVLQEAARINDMESISLLLQADANVMQKAENADWTALDYALEANALEAGRVLLEAANSHYLETLRAATVPYVPPAQGSLQAMINTGQSHWQPPANNAAGVKPESEERVSYALKR